jgi:Transglutaminase-like superfamily
MKRTFDDLRLRRPARRSLKAKIMALRHNKTFFVSGLLCSLLFAVLLLVRTGVVSRPDDPVSMAPAMPATPFDIRERWMAILQDDRRIGTTHSRLEPTENGYRLTETVSMRINTMGLVQDLALDSTGWLNFDLTLARFSFTMQSGLFRFAAEGVVEDDVLICRIQSGDDEQQLRLPLAASPYLPAGIFPAVAKAGLAPGERRVFHIFDPSTLAQEKITLAMQGRETLQLGNRAVEALKVTLEFKGISQEAWLDDNGQVLMEKGLLGIRQERISREEALSGQPVTASGDLTRVAAVVPDRELPDPSTLSRLTLALDAVDLERYPLDEGRQLLEGNRLTLVREDLSGLPAVLPKERLSPAIAADLSPSTFVQSDHPKIKALTAQLVDPDDAPLDNLRRMVEWMQANIAKRPVLSLPDAVTTLDKRMGDCNEHAVLMAALARAAGYPAQVEAGLVYQKGRFFYHAWNRIYIGRWITVDALFGQIPTDVTHIRFTRGNAHEQLDILPLLGKLQIRVLEME